LFVCHSTTPPIICFISHVSLAIQLNLVNLSVNIQLKNAQRARQWGTQAKSSSLAFLLIYGGVNILDAHLYSYHSGDWGRRI
jgi:hypothetical protein